MEYLQIAIILNCYKRNLGIWLNSTKTPGFTLLSIKLGVYLQITNFQRSLRKDRLSDL